MTTRRAHPVLQAWHGVMVAALLASAQPAAAQGTDVCVSLTGSNGKVSGLQMDLSWDPGCMTAEIASGTAAQCASNPSVGKSVQTNIFPNNSTMRLLFLSVSDSSPIPDGELFCCKFTLVGSQAGSCCSVQTGNVIFADAKGKRVYDPSAHVNVVVGGGAPCVTSPAGGSQGIPVVPMPPAAVVQPPVVSAPVRLPHLARVPREHLLRCCHNRTFQPRFHPFRAWRRKRPQRGLRPRKACHQRKPCNHLW
jgi:hypothetical protein